MPGKELTMSDFLNRREAVVEDEVHLFFILDNSGSMGGTPIQTLNEAMETVFPALVNVANSKEVTAFFHVLAYNTDIHWLCGSTAEEGIPMDQFHWHEIGAGGRTNTAGAIRAILPGLSQKYLGHKTYRPVIILITDGESDSFVETKAAIQELDQKQKTTRIAIGVQGYNPQELEEFASTGKVVEIDAFGDQVNDPVEQKLIFPVADAQRIAGIIKSAAVSSLIDSVTNPDRDNPTIEVPAGGWV